MAGDSEVEYFYKWCYGKWIIAGTIQTEDKKQKPQE